MEKPIVIYPQRCNQQIKHIEEVLAAADELGAAALSLHTAGHLGYAGFLEAREHLKTLLLNTTEHYRYVE